MARYIFRGDSEAREDIFKVTVNASIPGAKYGLKAWNRVLASVIATVGETIEDLTERFRLAVAAVGLDATDDERSSDSFFLTGNPGESLGPASDSSSGCYVQVLRAGVATTSQKFLIVMPLGASGGTWYLTIVTPEGTSLDTHTLGSAYAWNISESSLAADIEFMLNEYGSHSGTGVSVTLSNPGSSTQSRVYEVEMGGDFSGYNFTFTPNGDALAGVGSVTCNTVQLAAGSATCIQAMTIPLPVIYGGFRQVALKFSRDGVTSSEVTYDGVTASAFKTAVEAALAQVLGANQVAVTIASYDETLGTRGGAIVIVAKWLVLGTQTALSCIYYDKKTGVIPPNTLYPGTAVTRIIRQSGDNQSEFLLASVGQLEISGGVAPANYEVTQDATTWTITHSYTSTEANLVTQWESGVGSGNVDIHVLGAGSGHNIYIVEFIGAKENLDQLPVTFTTANGRTFQVICDGEPLLNEIQQVIINGKGGTFTASSDGTTYTSALAYNLSNSTFQTALRGLTAIGTGNCTVTGSGTSSDPFFVEYISGKAITDMPTLVFNISSMLGGAHPVVTITTAGNPGVRQLDKIIIDPNAISGTLRPIIGRITGGTVAWDGTYTNWTTAIEAIPSMGVTVTGVVGGPFFVEYDAAGGREMTLNQSQLVVSESTLFSIVQVQEATGPYHYNEPLNWSPAVVPGSDDTPVFMDSDSSLTEALRQRCVWTAETSTGDMRLGTDVDDCGDFAIGQKVRIATSGSFPTATLSGSGHTLSAGTDYYVVTIDRFGRRMGISTSASGATIELTSAGTGVHTVTVRWAKIEQRKSHGGDIGRSRRLGNGWEERPRYLTGESPIVEIGAGETGNGTGLCFIDLGTLAGQVDVWHSGRGNTGEQAVQLRANSSSIDVRARGGELGLGTDDVDVVVGDLIGQTATVVLGRATLTSIDLTSCDHSFPQGVTVSGTTRIVQ